MHIMTALGWRPIDTPKLEVLNEDDGRYRGPLPSFECQSFIKKMKKDHQEYLDRRMGIFNH